MKAGTEVTAFYLIFRIVQQEDDREMGKCILIMLVGSWMFASDVLAFWPFWGSNSSRKTDKSPQSVSRQEGVTRKFCMSIPDKRTEQELLKLFATKKMFDEDIRVLTRLLTNCKAKFSKYQEDIRKEFLIVPEVVYEYDDKDKTIYRIDIEDMGSAQTNITKDASTVHGYDKKNGIGIKRKRIFHKKLTGDEEKRFGELVVGRRKLSEQVGTLEQLLAEQKLGLENTTQFLAKRFSLKEGRYYDYDVKEMILYEIVPPDNSAVSSTSTR